MDSSFYIKITLVICVILEFLMISALYLDKWGYLAWTYPDAVVILGYKKAHNTLSPIDVEQIGSYSVYWPEIYAAIIKESSDEYKRMSAQEQKRVENEKEALCNKKVSAIESRYEEWLKNDLYNENYETIENISLVKKDCNAGKYEFKFKIKATPKTGNQCTPNCSLNIILLDNDQLDYLFSHDIPDTAIFKGETVRIKFMINYK